MKLSYFANNLSTKTTKPRKFLHFQHHKRQFITGLRRPEPERRRHLLPLLPGRHQAQELLGRRCERERHRRGQAEQSGAVRTGRRSRPPAQSALQAPTARKVRRGRLGGHARR